MADAGPPVALMAFGLVLWLAVNATLAGISIQTVGVILFLAGAVWLAVELVQSEHSQGGGVRQPSATSRWCVSATSIDDRRGLADGAGALSARTRPSRDPAARLSCPTHAGVGAA